jgi:hypothetical protein
MVNSLLYSTRRQKFHGAHDDAPEKPCRAAYGQVRVTREGTSAMIEQADANVSTRSLTTG